MTKQSNDSAAPSPLHFCTIVSKNYIAQARTLAESVRIHHPDSSFTVLLVDRPDGYFDPNAEPFTVLPIERLPIPDLPRFCFQYNVLELNTAAKPFFLAQLLKLSGTAKLVYLDPDIVVLHRLDALARLLDEHNVVLTPHLLEPYPLDGKRLHERHILLSGTYNLGFVAVSAGRETDRMLRWWQERMYTGCRDRKKKGMFVDQKWMELAPSYFDGVHILREPGYNIAYWNLHSREITLSEGRVWAAGRPAYFFHFSGFDPSRPLTLSKHQNRLHMEDLGAAPLLFADYAERPGAARPRPGGSLALRLRRVRQRRPHSLFLPVPLSGNGRGGGFLRRSIPDGGRVELLPLAHDARTRGRRAFPPGGASRLPRPGAGVPRRGRQGRQGVSGVGAALARLRGGPSSPAATAPRRGPRRWAFRSARRSIHALQSEQEDGRAVRRQPRRLFAVGEGRRRGGPCDPPGGWRRPESPSPSTRSAMRGRKTSTAVMPASRSRIPTR